MPQTINTSHRVTDPNGWTFIPKNPISKSGVFPYLGSEIGAPEPHRVYSVFRPPEELEGAAETFQMLPFIDEHELLGALGASTDERPPSGFTGENVIYEHPYLYAPLKITSPRLMELINQGKVQLSPAYSSEWEPSEGVYEGKHYEYIQRVKHGNHIALVSHGRTGLDVAVLDHKTFSFDTGEKIEMNLEQLLAAAAELSDEEKAQLLGMLSPSTTDGVIDKDEPTADAGEAAELAENAEEAVELAEEAESASVEGDDVKAIQAAGEAVENAEAVLEAAEELRDKIATDAINQAVKHIDARNAMVARVKPFIGAVPAAAMDSAESVAAYALSKFGVKHKRGQATAVITGYLHGRKPASQRLAAMDSKPVSAQSTAEKLWKE